MGVLKIRINVTGEISSMTNQLMPEEWELAEDEERLAHILSGTPLSLEQVREILEQIEADLVYEQRYLHAQMSAETLIAEELQPSLASADEAYQVPALEPQPSHTLLPVDDAWQWTARSVPPAQLVRLQKQRLHEIQLIQQALWRQLEALDERQQELLKAPKRSLPKNLPQQTSREIRNTAIAVADGHSLRRWENVEGEAALTHVIPGESLRTKLTAGPGLDWWGLPATYSSLREELQKLELPAVILLNILIGAALVETHPTASLDEMIAKLGWEPRTSLVRDGLRRKIWRWLLLFDSLTVHGKRPGRYKDRLTNQWLDLTSADALIKLTGTRGPTQLTFDNSNPPIEVSWVAGPWLDRFRHDRRVLQFLGDIYKIASIPAGRPSGAWAQSIGLALNQFWRQQALRGKVSHCGNDNRPTIIFDYPFTRYGLLDMFRTQPWVGDILAGPNPNRAETYWKEAIRMLKHTAGMIGYCEPKNKQNQRTKRSGWQDNWLYEELDIRPKDEWMKAVVELSKKKSVNKRRASKKRDAPNLF